MLYDLWADVQLAPCTVTQNDSPSVGADLLRDWLGPVPPGWSFFSFYFSFLGVFFNVWSLHCIDQGSVLHVYALRTAWTVAIFFVSVFLLLCNLFSQCMGVHCLVNHTRNALIMVLYCMFIYFCTSLFIYVFASFPFLVLLLCILFSNLGSCIALLGMLRLHSTDYVLHSYTTCTACVLFAFCTTISSPAN